TFQGRRTSRHDAERSGPSGGRPPSRSIRRDSSVLPRRSAQSESERRSRLAAPMRPMLMLRSEVQVPYAKYWLLEVQDISELVREQKANSVAPYDRLVTPREDV